MNYAHMDDAELVALTLSGDQSAYEQLVIRHQAAAISAAARVIGSPYLAEDAVQDAFVTAWMKLDTLDQPEKFGVWVCRIARNCALNMRNRIRDTLPEETLEQIPEGSDASPEELLIRSEDNRTLRESIAKLPEKIAETIRLHYFHGLSVAEIAARLGLSEGGVKWRLYKGREKLREDLSAMNEGENDTLVQRVMKKVEDLKEWAYKPGRHRREDLDALYEETLSEVTKLPDSTDKYRMLSEVLERGFWWIPDKMTDDQIDALWDAAVKARNEEAMKYVIQNDYHMRPKDRIKIILEKRIHVLEMRGYTKMLGWAWFWLGRAEHASGDHKSGFESFEMVRMILTPADAVYAATVSAEKLERDRMEIGDSLDEDQRCFAAFGTVYRCAGGEYRVCENEAYTSEVPHMRGVFFYPTIWYAASRCKNRFFFDAKEIGDSLTGDYGHKLVYGGAGHSVETPAGVFENCVLWSDRMDILESPRRVDTFYKEGVGIVRQDQIYIGKHEFYQLAEYSLTGGSGLLPTSAGNRWRYVSSRNSAYYDGLHTVEITHADADRVTTAGYYRIFRYGYDPENWREMAEAISSQYVSNRDGKWEITDVRPYMERMKVLAETPYQKTLTNVACRVMERILITDEKLNPDRTEEGVWNIFRSWRIRKKDGRILLGNDWLLSLLVTDYTTTPDAIRCCSCYGALSEMIGDWDDAIVNKQDQVQCFEVLSGKTELTVTKAGTITTPAGSFDNCLEFRMRIRSRSDFEDSIVWKEYCFAPGIGIVRAVHHFDCDQPDGVYELCEYTGVGEGYFPQEEGSRRLYRAVGLPEGYQASAEYTVVRGDDGELYLLTDQMGRRTLNAEKYGETDEILQKLMDLANAYLKEHRKEITDNDCVIFMISSKKNVYHICHDAIGRANDIRGKVLQILEKNDDTVIERILCMFRGGIDIPSYSFRKVLVDLNKENLNAIVYGQGLQGIVSHTIADMLPPDEDSRTDQKN